MGQAILSFEGCYCRKG